MNLSRYPIAPISLPSGPFYRPVTITLYNTCHYFFTLCVASWEHFGNLLGPDLAHFTNVHFAPHQPMCPLLWHADLHSASFPSLGFSSRLFGLLSLPAFETTSMLRLRSFRTSSQTWLIRHRAGCPFESCALLHVSPSPGFDASLWLFFLCIFMCRPHPHERISRTLSHLHLPNFDHFLK
jgi:hypothetical protein